MLQKNLIGVDGFTWPQIDGKSQ